MTFALDPEILQTITALVASGDRPPRQPVPRGDWKTLRANSGSGVSLLTARMAEHPEVSRTSHSATSQDGAPVPLRWFARRATIRPAPDRPRSSSTAAG
jgi:hypothetical protein